MILDESILPKSHLASFGVSLSGGGIVCFWTKFDSVPFSFFELFVGFLQVVVDSILTVIPSFGSRQLEVQFSSGFKS